ncbi:unnamed protein product [Periconia digitata]|uniref:Uncharacterized protein n=1 Tax=Periconia digitata TaxID=1303443 RepID=A0A9W4UKE4_9PLEO|nr:unnamed protein product [Periconia digitata]
MASLMTLPRELRDQICKEVILSPLTEPPELGLSFDAILDGRRSYQEPKTAAWSSPYAVRYQPSAIVASVTPLLLVNHQLYAETMDNLRTMPQTRTCDLDLIVLDEMFLCPTWIRVPVLTNNVDRVNVKFRIAGFLHQDHSGHEEREISRYSGFRGGFDAVPTVMAWQIYDVLDRFLTVGPVGARTNAEADRSVVLKTLDIDIQTPPNVEEERFSEPGWGQEEVPGFYVLDPNYLARFVYTQVEGMMGMHADSPDCGKIFYEFMNEVVVSKDGQVVGVFDVASYLQGLEYSVGLSISTPSGKTKAVFDEWKKNTIKKRRERGLKVLAEA